MATFKVLVTTFFGFSQIFSNFLSLKEQMWAQSTRPSWNVAILREAKSFVYNWNDVFSGSWDTLSWRISKVEEKADKTIAPQRNRTVSIKPTHRVFLCIIFHRRILKTNYDQVFVPLTLKKAVPHKSLMPAFRKTKNLKELLLAPSKFKPCENNPVQGQCVKREKNCDLCQNFLVAGNKFESFAFNRTYPIKKIVSCTSSNL